MGAYAVEYITASSRSQRGYYEISIQVSYRRTAEQIQAVVNATSTEALSALLEAALDEGRTELAVRVGYWGEDGQARWRRRWHSSGRREVWQRRRPGRSPIIRHRVRWG